MSRDEVQPEYDDVPIMEQLTNEHGLLLDQRSSLADRIRKGVPPARFLPSGRFSHERLFYDSSLSIISGHKKSGKTLATLLLMLDCVDAGRPVVYIDLENGPEIMAERLAPFGLDLDRLEERLDYIPFPRGIDLATLRNNLEDIAARRPGAVVIIDSLRGLFTRLSLSAKRGLKLNEQTDMETALSPVLAAVKTAGLTVWIIDHAPKAGTKDSEYSTAGTGAKEQIVDAVYFFTKEDAYSEEIEGAVSLKVTSDRRGKLPVDPLFWRVGGQGESKPVRFTPTFASLVGSSGRTRRDVREFLASRPGERFNQSEVEEYVEGKAEQIRRALRSLADDDSEPICRVPGKQANHKVYVYDPAIAADQPAI